MALSAAGPSRLEALADSGTMEHLPSPHQPPTPSAAFSALHDDGTVAGLPPTSYHFGGTGTVGVAAGQRLRSAAASTNTSDSGSIRSTSTNSRERVLGSIFGRRGSTITGRRPKSVSSNRSSSAMHDDLTSSEAYEMSSMSRNKKKRMVEDIEKRVDRAKADAALAKWRRWIVEQAPQEVEANPLYPAGNTFSFAGSLPNAGSFENHSIRSLDAPMSPPFLTETSSHSAPALAGPSLYGANNLPGLPNPPAPARIAGGAFGSISSSGHHYWSGDNNASSSSDHHALRSNTPQSTGFHSLGPASIVPGAQDIYTTESVRALRDVELAIDPSYFGAEHVSSVPRTRRLSTHPRVSEKENPFAAIDSLICRRGIRPLVLELVYALGVFIDAVWATANPSLPNPWAGVPLQAAVRRASALSPISPVSPAQQKAWHSWTLTAIREAKRRNAIPNPPTQADVAFWGMEIRYGLRDIDEAVNRRKDLGWAFGEVVMRGHYGDIVPANVFAPDGSAGNMPRLLNDLEEAIWGDAIPAPSDLAFEHDCEFDPFSVYRDGDELIGVEAYKQPEVREAELRRVFGDSLSLQAPFGRPVSPPTLSPRSPLQGAADDSSAGSMLHSPDTQMAPSFVSSPFSRSEMSPRTPVDANVAVMPDMDFSALGALQELSLEEKLELGRRRHQEYLERTRAEEDIASGVPGIAI